MGGKVAGPPMYREEEFGDRGRSRQGAMASTRMGTVGSVHRWLRTPLLRQGGKATAATAAAMTCTFLGRRQQAALALASIQVARSSWRGGCASEFAAAQCTLGSLGLDKFPSWSRRWCFL